MNKVRPVSIMMLCNDGDNGMFTGICEAVDIGDSLLRLRSKYLNPKSPRLSYDFEQGPSNGFEASTAIGKIRISRRAFSIHGYKYGFGNWCWDLVIMTPATALEFPDYLKLLDMFGADEGDTQFYEAFEDPNFVFTNNIHFLARLMDDGYAKP